MLARAVEGGALAPLPLRILIEVMGEPAGSAPRVAGDILRALDDSPLRGLPRLLHGEGEGCWPLVAQAAREGLLTRIGLEDTTAGPDGEPVSGNAELVRLALSAPSWRYCAARTGDTAPLVAAAARARGGVSWRPGSGSARPCPAGPAWRC